MRQQVLKALANPARIFYVPYSLAVLNFAIQFIIFIAVLTIVLIFGGVSGGAAMVNPMYFLISVIIIHMGLAFFAKQEPQLAQIISSKIQLWKARIPNRLNS